MHDAREVGRDYPVKLSILQRRLIAGLAQEFADRLKLSEQNQRVISLDQPEWTTIPAAQSKRRRSLNAFSTNEADPCIRRLELISKRDRRRVFAMAISRSLNGSISSRSP